MRQMQDIGPKSRKTKPTKYALCKPTVSRASDVHALVRECAPLDENSLYFYLVQCEQFRDTCVVAERDGEVFGWLSAHIPPSDPTNIFVWQVAVSPRARGAGLGRRMLDTLMRRPECNDVRRLTTTITDDNAASWALFSRFAKRVGAEIERRPHYLEEPHFDGQHETEHLVTLRFADLARAAA